MPTLLHRLQVDEKRFDAGVKLELRQLVRLG